MQKAFIAAFAAMLVSAASAAPEITVSADPALPTANLVKNGSFEDVKPFPWKFNGGSSELTGEDAFAGKQALRIPGDKSKRPNAAQSFTARNIKAGDPVYLRFAAKKTDADIDKNPASIAWQFYYADKTRAYMPTVTFPREDYDWTVYENVITAQKDLSSVTFYLCHYNQEGTQFFDDVIIQGGSTQLNINVKGSALKNVKVRHSVTGTVLDEKASGTAFSKTIKVPAFGSYSVEVTENNGERTCKLYPENTDANRSGDNIVPLTPVKRVAVTTGKGESLDVVLPADIAGKKVFMEFSGRCTQTAPAAGYTGMLRVSVNGKVCRAAELVKPTNRVTTANGGEMQFTRNNGYVLYYSNACYGISEDNGYSPVSLPDRNPFNFRLDITKLVKPGLNSIKLENVLPARMKRTLFIDNAVLVME